jgi:hypothetical protein
MKYSDFYNAYTAFAKITEHQAMACIRNLTNEGYVNSAGIGFELEHKAYKRRAYAANRFLAFFGRSILTPIVVTLLTLITINLLRESLPPWLLHLLGQLQ